MLMPAGEAGSAVFSITDSDEVSQPGPAVAAAAGGDAASTVAASAAASMREHWLLFMLQVDVSCGCCV
jgi:hypothetical protein